MPATTPVARRPFDFLEFACQSALKPTQWLTYEGQQRASVKCRHTSSCRPPASFKYSWNKVRLPWTPEPGERGSSLFPESPRRRSFCLKLASKASKYANFHLFCVSKIGRKGDGKTHASGNSLQYSGKLIPACGHARHGIVNSPCAVVRIPSLWCPRPKRLCAFVSRQARSMFIKGWARSYHNL
jgi:hypothetical protein